MVQEVPGSNPNSSKVGSLHSTCILKSIYSAKCTICLSSIALLAAGSTGPLPSSCSFAANARMFIFSLGLRLLFYFAQDRVSPRRVYWPARSFAISHSSFHPAAAAVATGCKFPARSHKEREILGPKLFFVTGLVIFATAVARLVCPDLLG